MSIDGRHLKGVALPLEVEAPMDLVIALAVAIFAALTYMHLRKQGKANVSVTPFTKEMDYNRLAEAWTAPESPDLRTLPTDG